MEGRYVSALYSAASQKKQLDEVEKSLRDFQKLLTKPKIVDFIETSLISRAAKATLLIETGKQAGMCSQLYNNEFIKVPTYTDAWTINS